MRSERRWYTGAQITLRTALRTFGTLRSQRLGRFIPFVGVLLLGAVVMWIASAIAPLAPFVYSLF